LQGVYKKETDPAEESRAIRGGTLIAVAFALITSGLMFGWRHHEFMRSTPHDGLVASPSVSVASLQPSTSLLKSAPSSGEVVNRTEAQQ
jgi:hypothetical protein